ncbi:MAG: MFS transporter, partial [Actinobacteria bacterium]|nr:MFS transporter [Actinomycetota bacterium]
FVLRESRAGNPLIPLRIFRSRVVSGANVVQGLLVAGMLGGFGARRTLLPGLSMIAGGLALFARVPVGGS